MEKDDLLKIALDTRQFEIQMLWQRSNYFLIFNTAIAVGFFSAKDRFWAQLLAAVFGVAVSWLWYRVNLGGKYWQSRWEEAAWRLENECAPDAKLFAATESEVQVEVVQSLKRWDHKGFAKWLDKQILKKPSLSQQMVIPSLCFMLFWAFCVVESVAARF